MIIYDTIFDRIVSETEIAQKIIIVGKLTTFLIDSLPFIDEIKLSKTETIEMSYYQNDKMVQFEFKSKINIEEAICLLMRYRISLIHKSIKI